MVNNQFLTRCFLVANAVASTACMFSPNNGQEVDDITQPITFSGTLLSPGASVTLQAANSPAGPFRSLSGVHIRSGATAVPFYLSNGSPVSLYPWRGSVTIPASRWATTTDAMGCTDSQTFVRAQSGSLTLHTFDTPALESSACLAAHNTSVVDALDACTSPENPVVTVRKSRVFHGNVTLLTAADISAYRCYDVIEGNLSIRVPYSEATSVDLPRLTRVQGNLDVTYTGEVAPPDERESRCGMETVIVSHLIRMNMPALTTVSGNVNLDQNDLYSVVGPYGSKESVELGLNALSEVGGSLSIRSAHLRGMPCGLTSLSHIPGDVTLDYAGKEAVPLAPLLPSVREIGGQLEIKDARDLGTRITNVLAGLQRTGSLTFQLESGYTQARFILPALTDVTHTATFQTRGSDWSAVSLRRIGTLRLLDGGGRLESVGGATLELGGFELNNASDTRLLDNPTKVTLRETASVSLFQVPDLTDAAICDFASYHRARGWLGTISRDGVAVSCP